MKDEQDIIRQSEEMTDTRQPSFGVVILGDSVESRLVEKRNRRRQRPVIRKHCFPRELFYFKEII